MRFSTAAIHRGQDPDRSTGAVTVPVYQTSTYQQDAVGKPRGYEYSRTGNPTRAALETALAALEGGAHGLAFSSGVAAISAVLELLKPGDHVIAGDDLYGGTYRLFEKVYRKWGLDTSYVRCDDPQAFRRAMKPSTRLIWLETPTNPLLKICDVRAVAKVARTAGVPLAVDNTFASPYLQRPLELGADIVVHSTTKYLGGHSDLVGGAVVTSKRTAYETIKFHQNAAGAVPGPWDCWLVLRGIKTLAVRMREHGTNAAALARFLDKHPKVDRVYYPGLHSDPGHRIAKRQMHGFGGMVSLELAGGVRAVDRFLSRLKLFILAESLGGVESLVCYPPQMTHGSLPRQERLKRGIKDNLLRLSVGLEDHEDLLEDIRQALG
jgi:cystathionine gamma-synthase/cystathionine gamma-lyase